jgi:hypothetical protein
MSPIGRIHNEFHTAQKLKKEKEKRETDRQKKETNTNTNTRPSPNEWIKTSDAKQLKTILTAVLKDAIKEKDTLQKLTVEFPPSAYELAKNVSDDTIKNLLNGPNGPNYISICSGINKRFIALNNDTCSYVLVRPSISIIPFYVRQPRVLN